MAAIRRRLALPLAILSGLLLTASPASAAQTHLFQSAFNGEGEAPQALAQPVGLAVDNSGTATDGRVYVADTGADIVDVFDPASKYLFQIDGSETVQGSFSQPRGVAVDQSTGDLYVATLKNGIDKFDSTGKLIKAFGQEGQITGAATPQNTFGLVDNGVAIDPQSGDLYVASFENEVVDVFDSAGKYLRQFAVSQTNVAADAIDSQGNLFVSGGTGTDVYVAATGQLDPAYGQGTGLLDPSAATGVAIDPANDDVYVFDSDTKHIAQYDHTGAHLSNFASGHVSSTFGIGVGDTAARLYASDVEAGDVAVFDRASVPLPTPTTAEATALAATSATLNGSVNPEGIAVSECIFEYGETEAYGEVAPCETEGGGPIGSGSSPVSVHANITGLTAATAYHYRLLAADVNGNEHGTDQLFGEPPHIAATSVASITSSAAELQAQIDPGGVAAAYHFEYSTDPGFATATSVPVPDAAIASARSARAVSQAISGLTPETTYYYRAVATNSAAPAGIVGPVEALITHSTSLDATLPDDRAYELVSPAVKSTGGGVSPYFTGLGATVLNAFPFIATEDGSAITYTGENFFEALDGSQFQEYTSFRGPDGWTTRNTTGEEPEEAFAPLSPPAVPPPPVLPPSATPAAQVQEVALDGSLVFFTDPGKLTPDSTAAAGEPDLYRYDVEAEQLTDLSVDSNLGEHADVQGVLGVGGEGSAAGSYVYFVANGVLGDAAAEDAQPGDCEGTKGSPADSCNLYLLHEGSTTFIAALSQRDEENSGLPAESLQLELHDWSPEDNHTAEASPDGRYLAFAAYDQLTGPHPTAGAQVFRYGAATGTLVCASCNPDGSTSPAAGILSRAAANGHRQHYIADDGRLFFNDSGSLSPRDVNGGSDVYEFEDAGTGTCQTPGGCRSLISGGGGTGESYLVAAGTEGDDVFFTSGQRLSSEDRDESVDMYDARVDGRTPPSEPPICETGEACHGSVAAPPAEQTAGTAGFHGSGNPVEKPCKKGFVKKGPTCVKKPSKRHGHKKHHKRVSHKRGGTK